MSLGESLGRGLALSRDGRCAARQTDEGLMVLDLVDGETFVVDLPAEVVAFVDA